MKLAIVPLVRLARGKCPHQVGELLIGLTGLFRDQGEPPLGWHLELVVPILHRLHEQALT